MRLQAPREHHVLVARLPTHVVGYRVRLGRMSVFMHDACSRQAIHVYEHSA